MRWEDAAALGAVGGVLVQLVDLYGTVADWRGARRDARTLRDRPPPLRDYVDAAADVLVTLTRVLLGAAAGALFHNQVSGAEAAVAAGAAAPALLAQLGPSQPVPEAAPVTPDTYQRSAATQPARHTVHGIPAALSSPAPETPAPAGQEDVGPAS